MIQTHAATLSLALFCAAASAIDARTRRIPDWLNAAMGLCGLAAAFLLGRGLLDSVIGAAAGYLAIALLALIYRRLRGRDGIGLGDAKFLAASGAWLGWSALPFVVLLGSSFGLIWIVIERLRGKKVGGQDSIAFGPALAAGTFIAWLASAYV